MRDSVGKFEGDGELGQNRREFIGALGGALGIALVSDPIELASAAGKGGGGKGGRGRSRIPSGYVFHRVFTAGQHLPGLDDIAEILPGVMINDRSEIIFHATTKAGTRAVYRIRIDKDPKPDVVRVRKIVETGDTLADGFVVERIAAGDTNERGTYATVVRGQGTFNAVCIQRPGGDLEPVIEAGALTPGGHGRFTGNFGDVDLDERDEMMLVARYAVPGQTMQGLMLLPRPTRPQRGRILMRTGHLIPQSKAIVTGFGLVERRGPYFIVQVLGRPARRRSDPNMGTEPVGFVHGKVERGRRGAQLLVGSTGLRPARHVFQAGAYVGPRVHGGGQAATVAHQGSENLVLHRHRGRASRQREQLASTGSPTGLGASRGRARTISAPIFGHDGLLYYRAIADKSMELLVVHRDERRRILETGDRIGGAGGRRRVKAFNLGWHTDQADSDGRLAFQAQITEKETAIVVATPV